MVILDIRNMKTDRPSRSLDYKNLGPFKVIKVLDNMAYKLDLLLVIKSIHLVFHPWLLHLDESNPLPG